MRQAILPVLVLMAFLVAACGGAQTRTADEARPTPTPVASPSANNQTPVPEPATSERPGPVSEEQLREDLKQVRFSTARWDRTNFRIHSVSLREFRGGGPGKDDIPPLDQPKFVTVEQADKWLEDKEPVQVVDIKGDARAYPQQILIWHEVVNDVVGGEPVTVTY
ncbi:MAG: DUF3179 domain-containing protein [Chloroflexi bacterium]|nr:DUF3179 domain-containing protein [Chloroflexota bacterium]